MSFKREGTPEPMQTLKFRCLSCGQETLTLVNGRCNLCNLNDVNPILPETKPKKNKKK